MTPIRLMRKEDADTVRQVDSIAFGAWARQVRAESAPSYQRTRANVLACQERDPEGCFVAEEESQVVGFIFSRTWGSVGWFGTFAVLPEYQGRGIGQRLIAASLDYLRHEAGRVIGLETMPESAYNLGLYLKLAFRATFPTLSLVKALDRAAVEDAGLPRWSAVGTGLRARWLDDLREATGQILPGHGGALTATIRSAPNAPSATHSHSNRWVRACRSHSAPARAITPPASKIPVASG